MASALSPLDANQINSRTPRAAKRDDKMGLFENTPASTLSDKQTIPDDEVIDWDDDQDAGSSPFVPETQSRPENKTLPGYENISLPQDEDISLPRNENISLAQDENKDNNDDSFDPTATQFFETTDDSTKTPSAATPRPRTPLPEAATPSTHRQQDQGMARSTAKKRPSSSGNDYDNQSPPLTRKSLRFHSPIKPVKAVAKEPEQELKIDHELAPDNTKQQETVEDSIFIDDTCFSMFEAPRPTADCVTPRANTRRPSNNNNDDDDDNLSASPTPRRPTTPSTARPHTSHLVLTTPGTSQFHRTPSTAQSNTTNLIDFTQQIERFANASSRPSNQQSPSRRSPQKATTEPNLLSYLNQQRSPNKRPSTPAKSTSLLNLLDFELPPAPTPRSLPTITIRELESMKSQYQSQISSLKATLSGREAEVDSLKKAVGDAERRVGEAQEKLREEKSQREQIEHEKNQWEQRGVEFEQLLTNVREEVMRSDDDKNSLIRRAEESEALAEKNQARADDAHARIADLQAQLATARAAIPKNDGSGNTIDEASIQTLVQQQIDVKVEAVSRELHSVYKKKHETKVATLKKSYEARGDKKLAELQSRMDQLKQQNDELVANAGNQVENSMMFTADDRRVMEEANATIEEQRAALVGLETELEVLRHETNSLMQSLEQERVEKGELVAAVDEMLLLQSSAPEGNTAAIVDDFRKSISRPSAAANAGIPSSRQAPGPAPAVESRIGRRGTGMMMPRPSGISASKSKMMSNIERMGGAPKH
jgi:hypothetical protein